MSKPKKPRSAFEYLFCGCLAMLFISLLTIIGITVLYEFISAPYPVSPLAQMIAFFPFAMAGFFVLLCIGVASGKIGTSKIDTSTGAILGIPVQTGDSATVIDIPTECSSCGASLEMEKFEWVGPMLVQCPNCGAVYSAIRKES